jgi:hypothetical protein
MTGERLNLYLCVCALYAAAIRGYFFSTVFAAVVDTRLSFTLSWLKNLNRNENRLKAGACHVCNKMVAHVFVPRKQSRKNKCKCMCIAFGAFGNKIVLSPQKVVRYIM